MQLGNLSWDEQGQHYYYTGIDGVALYVWDEAADPEWNSNIGTFPDNPKGFFGYPTAWSGVTALNESPSGAESNKLYADNLEYLNLLSKEEFGFTLECYQVPDDVYDGSSLISRGFDHCDGIVAAGAMKVHGQARKSFGLVYRIRKGSDTEQAGELGYVYHIIYNAKASPSSRDFATVNDSPEAQTFSYECNTTDFTNGAVMRHYDDVTHLVHLEIDSSKLTDIQIRALELVLYAGTFDDTDTGSDSDLKIISDSYGTAFMDGYEAGMAFGVFCRMPTPDEIDWACSVSHP